MTQRRTGISKASCSACAFSLALSGRTKAVGWQTGAAGQTASEKRRGRPSAQFTRPDTKRNKPCHHAPRQLRTSKRDAGGDQNSTKKGSTAGGWDRGGAFKAQDEREGLTPEEGGAGRMKVSTQTGCTQSERATERCEKRPAPLGGCVCVHASKVHTTRRGTRGSVLLWERIGRWTGGRDTRAGQQQAGRRKETKCHCD